LQIAIIKTLFLMLSLVECARKRFKNKNEGMEKCKNSVEKKAAKSYVEGKTTLSESARQAGLTLLEMEEYLVGKGFKSQYSVEDLQKEVGLLSKA
jgi:predicted HTH domain antitoxin